MTNQNQKIKIRIPCRLTPGQQAVCDHPALIKGVNCHIGWGKTHLGANYIWRKTSKLALERLQQPELYRHRVPLAIGWYVTPTFELVEFATQLLKKWIPSELKPHWDGQKKDFYLMPYIKTDHFKDHRVKLSMRSGLHPELLLVDTVDVNVLDESRELSALVRKNTQSRLHRPGAAGIELVMGSGGPKFDPDDAEKPHWFYDFCLRCMSGQYSDMMGWKIGVNSPLRHPEMTPEIVEKAKRELANDPLIFERDYNAEFIGRGDDRPVIAVYSPVHQFKEISDRYRPEVTLHHEWDFGYGHPALSIHQFDNQQHWLILGERVGTDIRLETFAREALQWVKTRWPDAEIVRVAADHAGKQHKDTGEPSFDILQSIYESMGFGRLSIDSVPNTEENLELGEDIIAKQCAMRADNTPGLLVNESCMIINEALSGGWRQDTKKVYPSGRPKPKKDGYFDHLGDTVRIFALNCFDVIGDKRTKSKKLQSASIYETREFYGRS